MPGYYHLVPPGHRAYPSRVFQQSARPRCSVKNASSEAKVFSALRALADDDYDQLAHVGQFQNLSPITSHVSPSTHGFLPTAAISLS